ncbi:MAG: hypothetical protein ABS75_32475 [Pelagibacterium sp. SCN 63-23]|nr:MAG: hypothetical protein ABS75_32475 [Pelagibacterium sp. SCN 63-23]
MADYFTHFSCELDVGSPDNATRALEIYETAVLDDDPDHPLWLGFAVSIDETQNGSILWIRDEESGDPDCVVAFVLACAEAFDLKGLWGFQYANTCSRPRLDAFGGGAHLIDLDARKANDWIGTHDWLTVSLDGGNPYD